MVDREAMAAAIWELEERVPATAVSLSSGPCPTPNRDLPFR
jgi:hypothetical protein